MGKSSINGSFSMAMLNNQRVLFKVLHHSNGVRARELHRVFYHQGALPIHPGMDCSNVSWRRFAKGLRLRQVGWFSQLQLAPKMMPICSNPKIVISHSNRFFLGGLLNR